MVASRSVARKIISCFVACKKKLFTTETMLVFEGRNLLACVSAFDKFSCNKTIFILVAVVVGVADKCTNFKFSCQEQCSNKKTTKENQSSNRWIIMWISMLKL